MKNIDSSLNINFSLKTELVTYNLNIKRKITRIIGDSATGKTELLRLLSMENKDLLGIDIVCDYPVDVITRDFFRILKQQIELIGKKYSNHKSEVYVQEIRDLVSNYDNFIFFSDETFYDMTTNAFATFCKYVHSYFVLITRDYLGKLPYSYTELYNMEARGRMHILKPVFQENDFKKLTDSKKDYYIVEDSNSGYEFFKEFYGNSHTISAHGKDNVKEKLLEQSEKCDNDCIINIVADGAAFGSCIAVVLEIIKGLKNKNILLFLPESFEYLLLSSDLFQDNNKIYKNNLSFFSNERFYIAVIKDYTNNMANQYVKESLNDCYIKPCCVKTRANVCNLIVQHNKKKAVLSKYFVTMNLPIDKVQYDKLAQTINAFF